MSQQRFRRRYPELVELTDTLQGVHGIEDGGASAVVLALANGAQFYVDELAESQDAWLRFKSSYDAVRTGAGYVSPDQMTIGALCWVVLEGAKFTEAVAERVASPTGSAVIH